LNSFAQIQCNAVFDVLRKFAFAYLAKIGQAMKFFHPVVEAIDPTSKEGISLLLEHLCGERIEYRCNAAAKDTPCGNCQLCMNWEILLK